MILLLSLYCTFSCFFTIIGCEAVLRQPSEQPPEQLRQPSEQPPEQGLNGKSDVYYAVLCIENKTDSDLEYSHKWGNGKWQSNKINKKERNLHGREYKDDSQPFPEFFIKFEDSIFNGPHIIEKSLELYIAPENSCNLGKSYHFKVVGKQGIDLFEGRN